MSAAALLSLYVTVDTTRALLVFGALHSGVELAPSALTFGAEVLKLVVAVVGVFYTTPAGQARFLLSEKSPNESFYSYARPYLRFAIPAVLYGTNNVLYFTGLKITSPALLQVCVLSKLPLTALLHHLVIKRRRSRPMWISLGVLSAGLVVAGSPEALWDSTTRSSIKFSDILSGPVIGLTVGVVSACSSVYTELALKENIGFWQAQTYLYFWGTAFAGFAAIVSSSRAPPIEASSTIASLPAFSLVVTVTAATGLVVALILRQRDNLVKLVGSSLCITTVFILQHLFFPVTDGLDFRTTFGIGVLTSDSSLTAFPAYNHYKEIGDDSKSTPASMSNPIDYVELSTSEHSSPFASKDSLTPNPQYPDTPSSSFSSESPIFPPSSSSAAPDIYTPTPARLAVAAALLLIVSSLTSLQDSGQDKRTLKDLKGYFEGRKIVASSWAKAGQNENSECIKRTMEEISAEDWSQDPNLVMANSGCPVYPLPDEGLVTHLFWSGERWRTPTFSLATDSWLATQDTVNNKLYWWYETTPPPSTFVDRYTSPTSPYRSIVSFHQFNESLAESTCLGEMKEWSDLTYRKEVEMPRMTRRDLVKLLLLERYGGVWLDVDTIMLRDLSEIVRVGPGVVTENELVDNTLAVAGPVWGSAGHRMLETACQLPFGTAELIAKYPGLNLKAGPAALYSEGVVRLCSQEECGLSSLPVSLVLVPSTLPPCQPETTSSAQAAEALTKNYVWAPEMLSRYDDDACWDENGNTLVAQVRKRIDEILKEKTDAEGLLVNEGGALFPRARRRTEGDGV
ncbi:hypothetical protein JCM16303_003465 [Sporobolomyces ruberrimus]